MKKLVLFLSMIFSFSSWANSDIETKFKEANNAYEKGKYEVAISAYQTLLNSGIEGFNLHFNLGNSFYKIKEYPLAILHYEKALKIEPSNEDVKNNLKLAYAKTTDKIEPAKELVINRWYSEIINLNNANQWAIYSTLLLFLALLLGLLYLFGGNSIFKRVGFFSGILLLILSFIFITLAFQQNTYQATAKSGIIFTPTVSIKSAPGESGTILLYCMKGLKYSYLKQATNG